MASEELAAWIVAGIVAVVAVGLVYFARRMRNRAVLEEYFPAISNAEFLARCRPGTDPEIALKVRRIVADRLGVQYERVYPSSRFLEDIGAD
jgi:hypothetical protein